MKEQSSGSGQIGVRVIKDKAKNCSKLNLDCHARDALRREYIRPISLNKGFHIHVLASPVLRG